MSIYGQTKGTDLENFVTAAHNAEATGGMMYYALSRIAENFGMTDVAAEFIELGNQEMRHAGFYAVLNGKYPADPKEFWKLVFGISKAEFKGEERVNEFAKKLEEAGLAEAAETVRAFALEEKHHGEVTQAFLDKFGPLELQSFAAEKPKTYVCPVCGFEYAGDISSEPDGYKCPLCGVPKARFTLKG